MLSDTIQRMIPETITYAPSNIIADPNISSFSHWGIADYYGNTEKSFKMIKENHIKLYTTKDGFNYRRYSIDENDEIISELEVNDPIIISVQNLKQFIEDRNIDLYLKSMSHINELVDLIPREEQYTHILGEVYGLDYVYYQIQYDAMIISCEFDRLWNELYGYLPTKQDYINRVYKKHITIDEIINIKSKCFNNFITAKELYNIHGCGLKKTTKYIKEHYDEFLEIINQELWDYYKLNGQNLIDFYLEKWLSKDKDFFMKYVSEYRQIFKHYREEVLSDEYILTNICGYKIKNRDLLYYKSGFEYRYIETHKLFDGILSVILLELMREFENKFRKKKNMPNIGEGWVSETALYNLIKNTFTNTMVIHQGCPQWLGKQRFDIYIPEYNIAIEYQGIQHFKPIEVFGGVEGYEKTVERDNRKKQLCEENNCKLIYVIEGYNSEIVLQEIEIEINKQR